LKRSQRDQLPLALQSRMVDASMGIYIFNTDAAEGADRGRRRPQLQARLRPQHPAQLLGRRRWWPTTSSTRTSSRRSTGATWARSRPTTTPTWISARFRRPSTSTTSLAHAHPPYQYPPAKFVFGEPGRTGMAVNSVITAGVIISGAEVIRNSVLSQDVRVNSYADVDSSIIFSHVNIGRHCRIRRASSTATSTFPRARSSATTRSRTSGATSSRRRADDRDAGRRRDGDELP
jgi:glucose-1-phosphate adenylyltransferase